MSLIDTINKHIENDITYYKVVDIARILEYKDYSKSINNLLNEYKKKVTIKEDNKPPRSYIYLTLDGLKHLVINSRKTNSIKLAQELNIDVHNTKFECLESQTLQKIKNVFKGENMIEQYQILTYRIDLYFVDYNLCIECDERGHNDRDVVYERKRQNQISKELKSPQWIRFNPNENNFNIYDTINQIFLIIKTQIINK